MIVIIGIAALLLFASAVLTLWRMVQGPTGLDRIIASDVMVAIAIAAAALYSVLARNATGLPILLGLSLVGFTGAVGVARLITSSAGVRKLVSRRKAMKDDDKTEGAAEASTVDNAAATPAPAQTPASSTPADPAPGAPDAKS